LGTGGGGGDWELRNICHAMGGEIFVGQKYYFYFSIIGGVEDSMRVGGNFSNFVNTILNTFLKNHKSAFNWNKEGERGGRKGDI